MANEWFRNKTWSEAIELDFFNHWQLADFSRRVNALKIQADLWCESNDSATQRAGNRLFEKLLADYTNEPYELATVQEIVGEHYYKEANFETASLYFELVVTFYKEHKRIGVVRKADLLLAETILLRNLTDRFEEAYELVHQFPTLGGSLTEDHEQHYYYELLAYISYGLGKKEEAADCAQKAIAIAQSIELNFMLGKPAAIEKCYEQLTPLAEIAANKQ